MDMFAHALDNGDRGDDSTGSDDVQLTLEEAGDDVSDPAMEGVVTALTLDANGQYQFRADNGQGSVAYRVVQVMTPSIDGQSRVVSNLSPNSSLLHTLTGRSSDSHHVNDSRLSYMTTGGIDSGHGHDSVASANNSLNQSSSSFYLMMTPQDGLQSGGHRQLAPRFTGVKTDRDPRVGRDDRKRATHNEVERRRRDKINSWIGQLGRLIPDCTAEQSKQGDSKGGILAKTCEYIVELQNANAQMADSLKETEQAVADTELLRQQYDELKEQNELLRAELHRHGIMLADLSPSQ